MAAQPFPTGYEPFTTLSAIAAPHQAASVSSARSRRTFYHPYNMARYLCSLDWLSGGRAGWNIVTSQAGEEHYGIELPPSDERYERSEEYLDVVRALWDAWDDDAVVNDRENATWARADRIHQVEFEGRFYRAGGQLFMHRSPQGWPVLVQAGQSAAGMDFAARNAEVLFTAQSDVELAREFYREIKDRASAVGRDPESVRVIPGITTIVAETREEALAFEMSLGRFINPEIGRVDLEVALQIELSDLDPDQPIPLERIAPPDQIRVDAFGGSRYRGFYKQAVEQRLTIRQMIAINQRALGHSSATGSAVEVADQMQEWFETGACDGFAIAPVTNPEGIEAVCNVLVPELRRRGLARTEYTGTTLRENLGLPRPSTPARGLSHSHSGGISHEQAHP